MTNEPTNKEILEAINGINTRLDKMDTRFDGMDTRFDAMDTRFEGIDKRFDEVDERFEGIDKRFDEVDERFEGIDKRLNASDQRYDSLEKTIQEDVLGAINNFATNVEERFVNLENTVNKMKSQMVTKDYLDEKLYDLRGDLVQLTRKEDVKLNELVKILHHKNILDETEERKLLAMEPFAKLSL